MKSAILLLSLFAFCLRVSATDAEEKERIDGLRQDARRSASLAQAIENYILHQLVEKEDFSESPDARKYTFCDLDKDGKEDLIVAVTLHPNAGADKEIYYDILCVLSSKPSQVLRIRSGRYDEREPVKFIVRDRKLFIEYDVWDSTDAVCCPSLKASDMLAYENGTLILIPRYGRTLKANKASEPTPGAVTPAALGPSRQP